MKKIIIASTIFCLIIMSVAGCSGKVDFKPEKIEKVDILSFRRPILIPSIDETKLQVNEMQKYETIKRTIDCNTRIAGSEADTSIPKDVVIGDLEKLFDALPECFADYHTYNKNGEFDKALKNIIKKLPDEVTVPEVEAILAEELSFIENSFFRVGNIANYRDYSYDVDPSDPDYNKRGGAKKAFMVANDLSFDKDDPNYKAVADGKELFIFPTLDEELNLVHKLYLYTNEKKPQKEITLADGSVIKPDWQYFKQDINTDTNNQPETKKYDNFLYVNLSNRVLVNKVNMQEFKEIGNQMNREELIVVDLRSARGNSINAVYNLLAAYLGEDVSDNYPSSFSKIATVTKNKAETTKFLTDSDALVYGSHLITPASDKVFDKDGIVIVLIDAATNTAGEIAADAFKHLSNTVIVGEASMGIAELPRVLQYTLSGARNSALKDLTIHIPIDRFVWNDSYLNNRYGLIPDIWMDGIDLEKLSEYIDEWKKQ